MCPVFKTAKYLFILCVISVITAAIPPRAFALEMSSKRDCVMCHIMWLDEFRTDKETLVEWQPGNVLMKDTQGVVSSEQICYSCHDGYVKDSRDIVWKFNRHPVFVKPSKNVTVPPELPLSVKGEIYCGTCHSAHGKGASPHGDPTGRTSVYRERNIDSSLCEMCHRNQADYKTSNSHPLHTTALKLPEKLYMVGAKRATEKNKVICQSCHRVHGALGERILLISNKNSELCMICHVDQKNVVDTKHDLRITLPGEKNIKKQSLSESGPCGACHTPHNAAGKKLWARPIKKDAPAAPQLCLSCHGEKTRYKIKRTGKYTHPVNVPPLRGGQPKGLPLFTEDGAKDPKGRVQCFTCHNVHRWDPNSPANKGGKDVEGEALNSFLRVSNFSSNLCLKCHTGKKSLITSDHNLTVTAPEEKNAQGFTSSVAGPCSACHVPHNAVEKHLWAKNLPGGKDFVSRLCATCHNKDGAAKKKLIGENYHPVNVTLSDLNITPRLPLYDSAGNKTVSGKLVCLTCHEPHTWDPKKPVIKNYAYKNMEGDATNSFLRKKNAPSSDLCKTCHVDKALVDGTDHDLNVTAPQARNLLGQTVRESGECGACHLVHNSPNRIYLWARKYGSIAPGEDIIDSLCTSCHSRGNPGEKRIPLIATHPDDRLINNVMRSDRNAIDYAPIYDKKTGKPTHVGNISCVTCHNAHQWSPLVRKKGSGKNVEGNATNSFLRNVSYNNICIDCHGLDALFRYKYFHDPVERVETSPPGYNIVK